MKIERLSQDKIRIFLTFDDLTERGIQKEDMWREIPRVHELFSEMMDQAYNELGFEPVGPLAVEVFALPAQGMVVIVTRGKYDVYVSQSGDDDVEEDLYEMEVTLEQSDTVLYAFRDIEHVIQLARAVPQELKEHGKLFYYRDKWILYLDLNHFEPQQYQTIISILAEFGEATSITSAVLEEYGKVVIEKEAIGVLCKYF